MESKTLLMSHLFLAMSLLSRFSNQASWKSGLRKSGCPWHHCCQASSPTTALTLFLESPVTFCCQIWWASSNFTFLDLSVAFPPWDTLLFWYLRHNSLLIFFMPSNHPFSCFCKMHLFHLIPKWWPFFRTLSHPFSLYPIFSYHSLFVHSRGCKRMNVSMMSTCLSLKPCNSSTWMFTRLLKISIKHNCLPLLIPRICSSSSVP